MNQSIRFCTAADGVRLAYATSGEGPPLVMAATWLTHLEHQWRSLAWRPWLEAFAAFTLLRHDSRGCGLSDRESDKLSFENWVSDLACVIDAAGFDRFPIVATCWGGPVAIAYAARHPERVSHLVLYGTYTRGRFRVGRPEVSERARLMLELTRLGWGQRNHAFMQVWASTFQPGGSLDYLQSWAEQMQLATAPDTAVRLLEIGWNVEVSEAARNLKCPVLVIHPDRDCAVPLAEGRLLASQIPDCCFVQLDSQNHMPYPTSPRGRTWCPKSEASWPGPRRRCICEPRCRLMTSLRANAQFLKRSQKVSITRKSRSSSGFPKRLSAIISPGCSTSFTSGIVTRRSCERAMPGLARERSLVEVRTVVPGCSP